MEDKKEQMNLAGELDSSVITSPPEGDTRSWLALSRQAILFVVIFAVIGTVALLLTHASNSVPTGSLSLFGGQWCLDNNHSVITKGNKLQLWTCNSTDAQVWELYSDNTIHLAADTSYCLDNKHSQAIAGNIVWLWACNGTNAQIWKQMPSSNGTIALVNASANMCLDDYWAQRTDGNKIQVWPCNSTPAQQWKIPTAPHTPTVSLSASSTSITKGGSATLTWSSTNSTSCNATGAWSGSKPLSGTSLTGTLNATATYGLTCLGAGGSANATTTITVTTPQPAPNPTPTPTPAPTPVPVSNSLHISIPAYFGETMWDSVVASYPTTQYMVANGDAGPTNISETQAQLNAAKAKGIVVLGYVHTSNGTRPAAQVEADIDAWRTKYGVTSIFFDEASNESQYLSYYQTLYNYVHSKATNVTVILNMGWNPLDQGYMKAADIINTFEDVYDTYVGTDPNNQANFPQPTSWMMNYPTTRFSNLIYDVPNAQDMQQVVNLAAKRHIGYVYIMNTGQWGQIPDYWNQEVTAVSAAKIQ